MKEVKEVPELKPRRKFNAAFRRDAVAAVRITLPDIHLPFRARNPESLRT